MKYIYLLLVGSCLGVNAYAQDDLSKMFANDSVKTHEPVIATYKSTRIIQGHSPETLKKRELDFRVAHHFGDLGGESGGGKTFFGMDNSTDVRIAFEYGVTDRLMVGVGRTKGSGSLTQMYEGLAKYRLLVQTTDNHMPVSVTLFGNVVGTAMKSSRTKSDASHFEKRSDRMSYTTQVILARKFNRNLSLTLLPTLVHRNRVVYMDENDIFALGAGGRFKFSKRLGLLVEYFYPFRSQESKDYFATQGKKFYNPLAVGLEIETGGHVFHVNFTNSTAILENQFIPETTTTWQQGQFRWGFNISRRFSL
ncbi:hypothetical protein SAMN05518672_1011294 [Chitinophaga sp. CF118]|uniref:DUF5777 family beta-barrel protein n=1 Tax=Chitinophaga sp. CF118 TaxID=1884367 RepID=UPI0008F108FE|nr:DUF5777 family beta-barrel protein [Chitinophaga sp. CF118]SFD25476.1 hypothetical protein SAMN05518672_1011294 [Chitinophaga sp. CF118]